MQKLDFQKLIQPLPLSAKFSDPDYYIWCGSAVKGDDGKYHLFYSRWPRKLGHNAWVTHSEIAHAVSDSPVPQQLSVVGLGNLSIAELTYPPLRTVA